MAFNHQQDDAPTYFDVQSPSSTMQSSNTILTVRDPGYPDLPHLEFVEPDPQWNNPMSFGLGVNALKEHELIKALKAMNISCEVEGDAQKIIRRTTNADLDQMKESELTPFGLNELQYIEHREVSHAKQDFTAAHRNADVQDISDAYPATWTVETLVPVVNPLGCQVNLRDGAFEVAQQSAVVHTILVSHQLSRFHQSVDTYAKLAAKLSFHEDRTKILVYEQAYMRVSTLQAMCVEPMVGKVSHDDQEYIDNFVDFGERLLAVMYVGLVMKESFGPLSGSETKSRVLADIFGSCLLEARKWQLGTLRAWITELDNDIVKMSVIVSRSLSAVSMVQH